MVYQTVDKKIKIITDIDRPHITYEILRVLKDYDIGIKNMEVYSYVIYLVIPQIGEEVYQEIVGNILKINGVKILEETDYLAFEDENVEMKKILDLIPKGIIVLDNSGGIKYSNDYTSERIFKSHTEDLLNRNIMDIIEDQSIKDFLQGRCKDNFIRNRELILDGERFLVDMTPINTASRNCLGYILSMDEAENKNLSRDQETLEIDGAAQMEEEQGEKELGNLSLTDYIEEMERKIIVEELAKNPSIRATARSLGVTHTLLLNRIKKYKIEKEEWK